VFVLDNSVNGTFVNNWPVDRNQHRELRGGDKIAVSDKYRFVFRQPDYRKGKEVDAFTKSYSLGEVTSQGYRCVENATGIQYIVKMYPRSDDENELRLFALTKLTHPTLQFVNEILTTPYKVYVITGVARGGDLGQYLRRKLKLREPEVRYIIRQLFSGIEYLHDRHIAHRYIELESILFAETPPEDNDSRVQLSNVGIPVIVGEDYFAHHWPRKKVYTAPELYNGSAKKSPMEQSQLEATDIWSLGVVLYACLCGAPVINRDEVAPALEVDEIMMSKLDFDLPQWENVSTEACTSSST
jgi:serine/threonine-protein kinase CHEK2